jgi:uncharacterized protein YqhQ
MESKGNMMFEISQEERQKLLNYLKGRPYEEVFTLIALIVGLKPLEKSKDKKDENSKDKKDDKKVN